MEDIVNVKNKKYLKNIQQKAVELEKKYQTKRTIDENKLKIKTPLQRTLSIIFSTICGGLVIISALVCFITANAKLHRTCPTFVGYSNMKIVSGSMIKSGFNIGDTIVVRSVDTSTLNVGDKIAFYVYQKSYSNFDIDSCTKDETTTETRYASISLKSFFGFQSDKITTAAQSGANIVFHHIAEIYKDTNDKRWFVTKGSSNSVNDAWYISEDMVVGIYDDSDFAKFVGYVFTNILSGQWVFILLVPVAFLVGYFVIEILKKMEKVKLECDIVEEKRKLTDPICVKNQIGFQMDKKTKYKVLAQATNENLNEYISLLWKDGSAPESIKKYYLRKSLLLKYNKGLLDINRKCQEMFKNNEEPTVIAEYYLTEKEKLKQRQERINQRIKNLDKKYGRK